MSVYPVRPRNAASLLIYRYRDGVLEVLMGRRGRRARFLPDIYVFPGGSVDPQDGVGYSPQIKLPFAQHLGTGSNARLAHALAMAAVREADEETGLLLRCQSDGVTTADLGTLRYIGRAITPTTSAVRFHARFFAAPFEAFDGELGGDGELVDLRWIDLENRAGYPLVDVTEFMLAELVRELTSRRAHAPLLHYVADAMRVKLL